jgi:hypothetical protein
MNKPIGSLSILLLLFAIYGCGSQKQLTENYVSEEYNSSAQAKTIGIISARDRNSNLPDSLFEKIYQKSSYLDLVFAQHVKNGVLPKKAELESSFPLSDFWQELSDEISQTEGSPKQQPDLLLVAYIPKFSIKVNPVYQNKFTREEFRPNQKAVNKTNNLYVPPKRFSFREFMYDVEGDYSFQTNTYFKATSQILLYNLNKRDLIFDVTFYSEFLPTKKFAKSWVIEQSYHYYVNNLLKKSGAGDTHIHIFSK